MGASISWEQPFPVLRTKVDPKAEEFRDNREKNLADLDVIASAFAKARQGGGEKYTKRHKDRGKLLPRERIATLGSSR